MMDCRGPGPCTDLYRCPSASLSCHRPSARQKKQQDPQHKGKEEENPERFSFGGFAVCGMVVTEHPKCWT